MWRIFTNRDTTNYGTSIHVSWKSRHNGDARFEINRLMAYYRERNFRVNNSNLLVRLIRSVSPGTHVNFATFIDKVEDVIPMFLRKYNITSPYTRGEEIEGNLYCHYEMPINLLTVKDTWKELRPLRAMKISTFRLIPQHPGREKDEGTVYLLDIRALLIQYYFWAIKRTQEQKTTDPSFFVFQYPLNSIIMDKFDLTMLELYLTNMEITLSKNARHPLLININTTEVERTLTQAIRYTYGKAYYIQRQMQMVPMAGFETSYDFFVIPKQFINNNNIGVWFYIYADVVYRLTKVLNIKKTRLLNSSLRTDVHLTIRLLRGGRVFSGPSLGSKLEQVMELYKNIKEIYY